MLLLERICQRESCKKIDFDRADGNKSWFVKDRKAVPKNTNIPGGSCNKRAEKLVSF